MPEINHARAGRSSEYWLTLGYIMTPQRKVNGRFVETLNGLPLMSTGPTRAQTGSVHDEALPGSIWNWLAAALALTIVLLWPAWYNGQPILFPDSVGYERAGAVTLAATHVIEEPGSKSGAGSKKAFDHGGDGVSTARSPYYGVPLTLAIDAGGVWAVAALQALAVATALLLALRRLRMPLLLAITTVFGLALFCGLAVYADALMPDVFVGLMVLGFAMVLATPQLPRVERLSWLLAIVVAMLFHKAFLAVGIVLTVVAAVSARRLLLERGTVVLLALCCAAGLGGHFLVEVCVRQISGQAPLSVPFMLARYADSTVLSDYLRDSCSPPQFVICKYRARLPIASDEFLWGQQGVYMTVSNVERKAIAAEANTVLRGAIAARPLSAAVEAVHGAAVQLFTVGVGDFALGIPAKTVIDTRLAPALATYPATAIARRTFPLYPLGIVAFVLYIGSIVVIFAALLPALRSVPMTARSGRPRIAVLLGVIIAGAVANAFVSGMLSGVFERYQGRVAWLLPFGAVVLWQAQRYRRSTAMLA